MTATFSLSDLISNYLGDYKSNKLGAEKRVSFSVLDILTRQREINSLWRACNRRNLHPVANTFLGRITSITLHP